MMLHLLPLETLDDICSFLYGFDLLYLSHTNSWALRVLSDNSFWGNRVSYDQKLTVALPQRVQKQRYLQSRSLKFTKATSSRRKSHRIAYALLERPDLPVFWAGSQFLLRNESQKSFSFDVWFCLYAARSQQPSGGVIYGLQGDTKSPPCPTESFVFVDVTRMLFCSVIDEKKTIAQNLELYCWYHVALTYDVKLHRQDVYVNGKNVWSVIGRLHSNLQRFHHEKIGTGFCGNALSTGGAYLPFQNPDGGWYSFNGIIDNFCVWKGVLHVRAVEELALGGQGKDLPLLATIKPSHGRRNQWIDTKTIRCSRPAEGKRVQIPS